MAKLCLCMAMKNEAATVERAIRSIGPIADYAVISIDNKDDQGTGAVAERAAKDARLDYHMTSHVWEDSFSAMRNGVMELAEKRFPDGGWLIWIDGHEYLADAHRHRLKSLIETGREDIWLYSLMIKMLDHSGAWRDSFLQSKCWRMHHGIRYHPRPMHNQISIESCAIERRAGIDNIWIMHSRTEENAEARAVQRNELLPKYLQPVTDEDEDAVFHMLAHWFTIRNKPEFWKLWDDLDLATTKMNNDCKYQVLLYAAMLAADDGEWDKSDTLLFRAERYTENRSDHVAQRGRNFMAREEFEKAFNQFQLCTLFPVPVTQSFAHVADYTWVPYANMACAMERSEQYEKAWDLYHVALQKGAGPQHVAKNIQLIEEKCAERMDWSGDKPRLLILDNLDQFSEDIAVELSNYYEVRKSRQADPGNVGKANVIWCEWCNENAMFMSILRRSDKVVFARLHGYEAIEQDYIERINWLNVDFLVGVSQQMLDYAAGRFGQFKCPTYNIPNAINLDRFRYRERGHGKHVAWVGLLNNKKNVGYLPLLAQQFPDHVFHISGRWQDARLEEYFNHIKTSRRLDNLIYAGWHRDIDGFLEDKNYILNTSLWESFSFALHEGMAKGIKPLCHDWVSVYEFIPQDLRWSNLKDLGALLDSPGYDSERYRKLAESYDVRLIAGQIHGKIQRAIEKKKEKAA